MAALESEEIEITDGMVEAGCASLGLFSLTQDRPWDIVEAVYEAMERARRAKAAASETFPC